MERSLYAKANGYLTPIHVQNCATRQISSAGMFPVHVILISSSMFYLGESSFGNTASIFCTVMNCSLRPLFQNIALQLISEFNFNSDENCQTGVYRLKPLASSQTNKSWNQPLIKLRLGNSHYLKLYKSKNC